MFKVGIIGAGWIAAKMAETLSNNPQECQCYAVASRSYEKAKQFASQCCLSDGLSLFHESSDDVFCR